MESVSAYDRCGVKRQLHQGWVRGVDVNHNRAEGTGRLPIAFRLLAMTLMIFATASPSLAGNGLTVIELPLGDSLNVRSAPGVRSTIVKKIPSGFADIVATGRSELLGADTWIEVTISGVTGWVNARFVKAQTEVSESNPPLNNAAVSEERVRSALIIGNSNYRFVPRLKNSRNDARAVAIALRGAGFNKVQSLENATGDEMRKAIAAFRELAKNASVAVIYYAGHGLEINGRNFIIPIDARIEDAQDVLGQAIDFATVLEQLDAIPATKIIMLDACRDNPFRDQVARSEATRSLPRGGNRNAVGIGFGSVSAGRDTLVAYAAKHGSYALDGSGSNSPFAEAVVNNLKVEGLEIGLFFRRVRDAVLVSTGRKQEPFTYGSLGGDEIFLAPVSGGISLLELNPEKPTGDFERTLKAQTDAIVAALKSAEFGRLAEYVHPISGLMFDGVRFMKNDLRDPSLPSRPQTFQGGYLNLGDDLFYSGERKIISLRDYTLRHLYSRDFLSSSEVSLGEPKVGSGGGHGSPFQGRPGSIFIDYFVDNSANGNGIDWATLRLILERYNNRWFLTEIGKTTWEP